METGKVIQPTMEQPQYTRAVFCVAEIKQLADFFSVLMEIDRRTNITKTYAKPTK